MFISYEPTSKGQQTEVNVYSRNKRDSYDETYTYNSLGKISLRSRRYPEEGDGSWFKIDSFRYVNDTMTTISFPTKNSITKQLGYSYHKYNKEGRKIEYSYMRQDGIIKIAQTWNYDESGNNIEEIRYLFSGKEDDERYVRSYDNKGNMIVETKYLNDSILKSDSIKYNSKNLIVEEVASSPNRQWYLRTIYKYDNQNNIVEETRYGKTGIISSKNEWKYKYDTAGNILVSEYFKEGVLQYSTTNKFTYY